MDYQQVETPAPIVQKPEIVFNNKEPSQNNYELKINNDTYSITIETINDKKIHFKVLQTNNMSFYYYEETYEYEKISKILFLEKTYYDNIDKVFNFCDKAMKKNKVSLVHDTHKNTMILSFKKIMDFEEVECRLNLKKTKITNEEMIKILLNEINQMKLNQSKVGGNNNNFIINNDNNNNELLTNLIKKNEELEKKMNMIVDENRKLKESINELQKSINELKQKKDEENNTINIEEENNFKNQNMNVNINFYGNPENLQYYDTLTNAHSNSGWLREFIVYTGLFDKIEYFAFSNKNNNNIDIHKLKDKKRVCYLKGHKAKVSVMRYFTQNNVNEHILSCDENRVAICWDIKNHSQKYTIYTNYSGYIWDALILFNINRNNYIILPSNSTDEFTRIYDFKQNTPFVKNIYGTKDYKTNYLIPWFYRNNYYLIECCNSEININNIFKDEAYAILKKEPEGLHCCGYIFNDNYLCVTDYNYNFLRIWNLVNKSLDKQIIYDAYNAYGIVQWNATYSIIACTGCLVVMDLTKERMAYKIMYNKSNFCEVKKVELNQLGECLVCSDTNNNIRLFNLRKI
jgi:hypothetical protein